MAYLGNGAAVLDQQVGMRTGVPPAAASPMREGILGEVGDAIDNTPRWVAGMVLGAALVIFAMRVAGFRFSFGANANLGGG